MSLSGLCPQGQKASDMTNSEPRAPRQNVVSFSREDRILHTMCIDFEVNHLLRLLALAKQFWIYRCPRASQQVFSTLIQMDVKRHFLNGPLKDEVLMLAQGVTEEVR
ncbi:hypothetical protein Tco_1245735 [Tanacetum coccineum]